MESIIQVVSHNMTKRYYAIRIISMMGCLARGLHHPLFLTQSHLYAAIFALRKREFLSTCYLCFCSANAATVFTDDLYVNTEPGVFSPGFVETTPPVEGSEPEPAPRPGKPKKDGHDDDDDDDDQPVLLAVRTRA